MQSLDPATGPISVSLADGNPLVLSAMSELFDRDPRFSLVATSATAEGFLGMAMRVIRSGQADAVLAFNDLGYRYDEASSSEGQPVFLRSEESAQPYLA